MYRKEQGQSSLEVQRELEHTKEAMTIAILVKHTYMKSNTRQELYKCRLQSLKVKLTTETLVVHISLTYDRSNDSLYTVELQGAITTALRKHAYSNILKILP